MAHQYDVIITGPGPAAPWPSGAIKPTFGSPSKNAKGTTASPIVAGATGPI